MLKLDEKGNLPTHEKTGMFFAQFVPIPGPLSGQVQLMLVPGSGIPMRDYFAAHALGMYGNAVAFDSSHELALWAYRVADQMLAVRKPAENNSQFHEDHMQK